MPSSQRTPLVEGAPNQGNPLKYGTSDSDAVVAGDGGGSGGRGRNDVITREQADCIIRRIDWRIMPLLFTTYMLNFMDKAILSSAAVFGLREDNSLNGADYSWVSAIFYIGYLVWTYPTTVLVARLPVATCLSANALFWGSVVALTAACSSYGGLVTARLLLGVAEATVSPALMFITSTWYTRDEIPTRTGIWFAGNSAGGIFASLLAFGVGQINDRVGPWRWMYIILGFLTLLWAVVLFILLPDTISSAEFLSPSERQWVSDRVVAAGMGRTENTTWKWEQVRECLKDPKAWMIWSAALLIQIPNGGTQSFANLVLQSFDFSALGTTVVNIPYSLLCMAIISGSGWVAGRCQSWNCALVALVVVLPIVGCGLIESRDSLPHGVSLFGYFLLASGPAGLPLLLSLVQANFRGVTKKMTMTAMLFVAYCAGNIVGPLLFIDAEQPAYKTAFRAIMICYSLVVVLITVLRVYLQNCNRRRQHAEGFGGSVGAPRPVDESRAASSQESRNASNMIDNAQLRPKGYEDVTDWEMPHFLYRL